MILSRQTFRYDNKTIIEKAVIRPPFKHERIAQDEGCFLYMKEATARLLSATEIVALEPREAVLLKCDTYFLDFIQRSDEQTVEVIAIHLYPEILKKIYTNELPTLIEQQRTGNGTQHLADEIVIAKFVESLEFYFEHPTLVNNDLLELKIRELVLLLIQTKNVASVVALINDLYSTPTVELREVVELHRYSNLSVDELAALCHMSPSTFKREFKKEYDSSPAKYISGQKLKKARELLSLSDLPISDIAYEVGFNDPLYFTRLFKRREGVSPSAYRSRMTG
ncbi:helix-turn-helix domain-containing protein [Lewinella sp. JB7]|uniref:AraC family transcriptional regulator n=1 Tax=Lewinella sp. JB7 TaxID=2962887 RepID=UPI0020C96931|nr:helix-turn-helix domain-containing protein [Lewinella sp. JB7]MCP9235236.1 AraC family transcriptional regulator [Lewinella sp. JB7]